MHCFIDEIGYVTYHIYYYIIGETGSTIGLETLFFAPAPINHKRNGLPIPFLIEQSRENMCLKMEIII